MSATAPWPAIAAAIAGELGHDCRLQDCRALAGGDISQAYAVSGGGYRWFVKVHPAADPRMFAAEHAALNTLRASGAFRVPRPLCHGHAGGQAYLVMEYLALQQHGDSARAGAALAALHREFAPDFGWQHDNFIGATPQCNSPAADWAQFWVERRLRPQLALARQRAPAGSFDLGERLCAAVPRLLATHRPRPSLLHGDLWRGNLAWDDSGRPTLFDPALYYGDRETDLAMSELFGGFEPSFQAAYREAWPLADGYSLRRPLYNLYHLLNHYNLFGGAYLEQSRRTLKHLLAGAG